MRRVVLGLFLASATACGLPDTFVCADDTQCTLDGVAGRCEVTNRCSQPDNTCPSHRRYHGAGDLDGQCVGSLVGYWPLDDGAGSTARDQSGVGLDGALHGTTSWLAGDGHRGGALHFARDGWFDVAALNGVRFPTAGTLALWFRGDFSQASFDWNLLDQFDGMRQHLFARLTAPNQIQIACQLSGLDYIALVEDTVPSGPWNQLVITWQSGGDGALTVYLDGVAASDPIVNPTWAPVGQHFELGRGFLGDLDEIRLYDRVLSASEVAALP